MSDVKTIKQGFIRSAVFMGVVGVILAIDTLTGDALTNWFGVRPRNLWGLDGILFSLSCTEDSLTIFPISCR